MEALCRETSRFALPCEVNHNQLVRMAVDHPDREKRWRPMAAIAFLHSGSKNLDKNFDRFHCLSLISRQRGGARLRFWIRSRQNVSGLNAGCSSLPVI